jgi:hypothetical protein
MRAITAAAAHKNANSNCVTHTGAYGASLSGRSSSPIRPMPGETGAFTRLLSSIGDTIVDLDQLYLQ